MHERAPSKPKRVSFDDVRRIAGEAFAAAREENRRLGIPNDFMRDGKMYWELPDGTITDVDPNAGRPFPSPPKPGEASENGS